VRPIAAALLRGFGYLWFALALSLILTALGYEFNRSGFWYGNMFTEWFSPFNFYGLATIIIAFGIGAVAFWAAEKLKPSA